MNGRLHHPIKGSRVSTAIERDVLLIHPSPFVRQAIAELLLTTPPFRAAGVLSGAADLRSKIQQHQPDLVLLEYGQWKACWQLFADPTRSALGKARLVLYGRDVTPQDVLLALRSGAVGFLHESCSGRQIINALTEAVCGRSFVYLGLHEDAHHHARPTPQCMNVRLTRREEEVLDLLLMRHSNDEIADRLVVSRQTVKNYVSRVYRKTGVSSRGELLRTALVDMGVR